MLFAARGSRYQSRGPFANTDASTARRFASQSVEDRREGHHPILAACCDRDQRAVAPLEALRMDEMCENVELVVKFSRTLRHLVLPGLIWQPAMHLAKVIRHFKVLEVCAAGICLQDFFS